PAQAVAALLGSVGSSGAGAVQLGAPGGTLLSGTVASAGGPITLAQPVTLAGDTTAQSGGGAIQFPGAIDGAFNLTVNATTAGNVTFGGAVGANVTLASLTVVGNSVSAAAGVTTAGPVSVSAG